MADKAKWTILTYIAAHDNLYQLGRKSLLEIINVGSTRRQSTRQRSTPC